MAQVRRRTITQRLLDRQWAKYADLAPESGEYSTRRNIPIRMRDGVKLLADLYEPASPKGTILCMSPYGWNRIAAAASGTLFACRGYRVLLVRCRGTFGSGGKFEPFRNEAADAFDVVVWMRLQAWWDGRLATFGYSYIGFTQWALLRDPPPELQAAVIAASPYNFYGTAYPGGAFLLSTLFEWSFLATTQEKPLAVRIVENLASKRRIGRALCALPVVDAARAVMKNEAPWFQAWVERRNDSAWWAASDHRVALDRVEIPVLLQGGWQDAFLQQTLEAHARLAQRNVPTALTIGPWTHAQGGGAGAKILLPDALAWFEEHLGQGSPRSGAVRIFVGGAAQTWKTLPAWPPPTQERTWYPTETGELADLPAASGSTSEFTYDPSDPTPTYGGAFVSPLSPGHTAGYVDDTALARRPDVLSFTSRPLVDGFELLGVPVVYINHASDNPYADLYVRVSDVDEIGRSRNVSDGYVRLNPASRSSAVRELDLEATAYSFASGHRLRLTIAGGSHPRWERNLGTSENPATSTRMVSSHRTIDLANTRIALPIASPSA